MKKLAKWLLFIAADLILLVAVYFFMGPYYLAWGIALTFTLVKHLI